MADFSSLIEFMGSLQGLIVAMAGTLILMAIIFSIVDSVVVKQKSPQIAQSFKTVSRTLSKKKIVGGLFLFFLVAVPLLNLQMVVATGQISPDSGTFEKDLPLYVSVQGLNVSTRHTIYTVQGETETLILNMSSSSAGKLTFSLIFTEAGEGRVEIRDITGVSVDCSANFMISDLLNDVVIPLGVWYALITITVAFLFGITALIVSKVKKSV